MIDSPILLFNNVIGLFGSPDQRAFRLCARCLFLSFVALPRVYRSHREIAIFALLATLCMAGFVSVLTEPTADGGGDPVTCIRQSHP